MINMNNKPGCFAAASVFCGDSVICQACAVFDACSVGSIKTLEAIKGLVPVEDLMAKHKAARAAVDAIKPRIVVAESHVAELDETPIARLTKIEKIIHAIPTDHTEILKLLSVKSAEVAKRLCEKGLMCKILTEAQEGRNALSTTTPKFLPLAVDCLIAGGFVKSDLTAKFMESFGWSAGTASSHVSIVVPVLVQFGIAQEISGRFIVTPKSGS